MSVRALGGCAAARQSLALPKRLAKISLVGDALRSRFGSGDLDFGPWDLLRARTRAVVGQAFLPVDHSILAGGNACPTILRDNAMSCRTPNYFEGEGPRD